jgi:photosystem II stability/assembly factor-like uncharacterized protein
VKSFIIYICLFGIPFSYGQWELLHPDIASEDNYFYDLDFLNIDSGFVVGVTNSEISILRTFDSGLSWDTTTITDIGIPYTSFNSIYFVNDTIGYIACDGDILKTTDCGNNWESLDTANIWTGLSPKWRNLCFINKDTGYVTYMDGGAQFLKTIDGGWTWTTDEVMTGARSFNLNDGIYTACWGGWGILDSSTTVWTKSASNLLTGADIFYNTIYNNGQLIIVGDAPGWAWYVTSHDMGSSWSYRYLEVFSIDNIQFVNDSIGYASGGLAGTIKTRNGGDTWELMEVNTFGTELSSRFLNFDMLNDSIGFGISQFGIFKTINGGGEPQHVVESYDYVSITENSDDDFNIYPNPVQDIVNLDHLDFEVDNLQIYSLTGQLIKEVAPNNSQINLSGLAAGTYMLKIISDKQTYTSLIMKE